MRKRVAISFVCQVATLLLVLTTGLGPSLVSLHQAAPHKVSLSAYDGESGRQSADSEEQDHYEIAAAPDATLPVVPLHLNTLSGDIVSAFSLIKRPVVSLPRTVAPATEVFFKTLFRYIISPNAP
ncbi:MAG: hypothetical protein WBB45_16975 [Cyclobacteriaceae bacterium]